MDLFGHMFGPTISTFRYRRYRVVVKHTHIDTYIFPPQYIGMHSIFSSDAPLHLVAIPVFMDANKAANQGVKGLKRGVDAQRMTK